MKAQLRIGVVDDGEILRIGKPALNIRVNHGWCQAQRLLLRLCLSADKKQRAGGD